MAAFSSSAFHHHHSFLLDSVFLPNSSSSTIDIDHHNCSKNLLLNISPPLHHHHHHNFNNHQNLVQNSDHNTTSNDANSFLSAPNNNKHSMDNSSSIVTDKQHDNIKKRKYSKQGSSPNSAQSKDKREVKGKKQKKIKEIDDDEEKKEKNHSKENKGYIHVRARRGQATDSHSLAERVRRERISERMKLLQTLVPGCDKVTGKALMLDEIINYVQSLQNQVEFLSMKLASVNPMFYDFGVDLESFMVRPDQDLSELPSPLPSMQECSPTTANNYNFLENPANNPVLFQQNLLPQPQGSRQSLWEVDEHRQKIINQSGFNNSHSLFSFH